MLHDNVARLVLSHHRQVLIRVLRVRSIDSLGSCISRLVAGQVVLSWFWFEDTDRTILRGGEGH